MNTKRFSFHPGYHQRHLEQLNNLERIKIPKSLRLLSALIVTALVGVTLLLCFMPWVQTASGMGVITALDPQDRTQSLNAPVDGRLAQWYVQEGQHVKAGDPIVRIQDIDHRLTERLQAQRDAAARKLQANQSAVETAVMDYERKKLLWQEGLVSRLDYENARIKLEELKAKEEEANAALNQIEVDLSRQSSQLVTAPRDGILLRLANGDSATIVSRGTPLATFLPEHIERALEIYIDGRDIGLIHPGRSVRIQFEGWPAFQFTGIPEIAIGTFAGKVHYVEPTATANGQFRVLIVEDPDHTTPWPPEQFVRLGAQARAWVLLDTVRLGYELWRQLNNFPPINTQINQANVLLESQ